MTDVQPQDRHVVLIGFMGTGKTTVGTRLARELGREFVDIDHEIESVSGMTISEMFRKYGETRFRSEEHLATAKLAARRGLVISTGGGWVLRDQNVQILKPVGLLVWLKAEPELVFNRVMRKKHSRPLLKHINSAAEINEMMEARKKYYEKAADIVVDTGLRNLRQVVQDIAHYLEYNRLP